MRADRQLFIRPVFLQNPVLGVVYSAEFSRFLRSEKDMISLNEGITIAKNEKVSLRGRVEIEI